MKTAGNLPKTVFLALAIALTAAAMVLAAPDEPMQLPVLGDSAVNTAPAIKISLAGEQAPEPKPASQPEPAKDTPPKPAPEPEPEPEPKPEPEPQPEPEPIPEPEPEPEPTPEPEPVPEPEPEPEPQPEPQPEPEPTPEPQPEQTAPAEQVEQGPPAEAAGQEADDQDSQNAVALQNAGNSADVDSYLSRLSRHLARYYEYPRRARRLGQEGTPVIVFEFSRDGTLVGHSLRDSSGHRLLDEAAQEMLTQAAPLPEVPDTMTGRTFTYALPVRFSLR